MRRVRRFFANVLTSGYDESYDPEISRKVVLLNVLCLLNAIFALIRGVDYAFNAQSWGILLLFSAINLSIMVYLRISKRYMAAAVLYVITHVAFVPIYNIYSQALRNFFFSTAAMPVEMIFLLGHRKGSVVSALFLGLTLVLLWDVAPIMYTSQHREQMTFFIWFYLVIGFLVAFVEFLRADAYKMVKKQKKSLESVVARLNDAYRDLSEKEQNYHDLVQKTNSVILKLNGKGVVTFFNHYAQEFFGFTEEEILGRHVVGTIVPEFDSDGNDMRAFITDLIEKPSNYEINETENVLRNGKRVWVYWTNRPHLRSDGTLREMICIGNDISDRKKEEDKLCHLATHDVLTGLPNRLLFHDRLYQAVTLAERTGDQLSIMMLDLDRFKIVNDTHGHDIGDLLLKQVSSQLTGLLRKSDTVGRIGGDEFLVLLSNVGYGAEPEKVAQKIIETLEKPFDLNGITAEISVSIGIAVYPDDGDEPGTLIKKADEAMYAAKRGGRGSYRRY